ncbi:hypothetical protein [Streptomyces sp. JJ38]|uniref:hypothetical protein n=1 Tax=Streptomyces sp. JJ38 TaxID=2738128 RepID=UPI001C58E817|nr:hypothetical protein [Streptomyces sp. JJ38]MBW1598614.1 hypothetical protein [Streptomyces sp. JJ38]
MRISHRRTAVHCLVAVAFGAAVLTGCGSDDGTDAAPQPSVSTQPSAAPASDDASAPADEAPFAGTKQFVQIENAWTEDGKTYVSVRPAEKEAMTEPHEAWIVVPGEGPYTTVPLADEAQVLLSVPLGDDSRATSYSQAEFVSRLTAQEADARPRTGYDLSFDGEGNVTRLKSLYTS